MPAPRCKIYPLDQTELAELKKQIIDLLKENKIWLSDSPYGPPSFCQKEGWTTMSMHLLSCFE